MEPVGPGHLAGGHAFGLAGVTDDGRLAEAAGSARGQHRAGGRRHLRGRQDDGAQVVARVALHARDVGRGGRRHHAGAPGHGLALRRVDQSAALEQDEAVAARGVEDVRGPGDAAGVVAAEHGEEEADVVADVLEAAEHVGGQRDDVARTEEGLAVLGTLAGAEGPGAGQDDEDLGGLVAMLGVDAARGLTRAADVEAVGEAEVDVLVGVLGDAGADDGEVLLALAAGSAGVDEGVAAGTQVGVADESGAEVGSGVGHGAVSWQRAAVQNILRMQSASPQLPAMTRPTPAENGLQLPAFQVIMHAAPEVARP